MIKEFNNLRDDEIDILLSAPVMVSILIAGADDKIDNSEIKQSVEIAQSKKLRARDQLIEFYNEVGENFEEKFTKMVDDLPHGADARNETLTQELRKLNHILPKIDRNFAIKLHASLQDMAKKVAEASGGILGYMSVSYEEAKLMELKMIQDPSEFD